MDISRIDLNEFIPDIKATTGLSEVSVIGNLDLLKEPRAAIMNSRQGKTPDSSAQWIKSTTELVKLLLEHKAVVISSVGMTTWELVTYQVGAAEGSLILVIPDIEPEMQDGLARRIVEEFELQNARILFIFPDIDTMPDKNYRRLPKKDFWIASISDRLYPVSVRNGGNQSKVVELFSIIAGRVSLKFQIDYDKSKGSGFSPDTLPKPTPLENWESLTHWTRTCIEPWPGETKAEYYRSILDRNAGYSHDGFNTLCRILRDMKLRASDKLIRGGYKTVSWTEVPPWELQDKIHWRHSLQRWTFEPYGIAIKKDTLIKTGLRKVLYGLDYQYRFLQEPDQPYFQAFDPEGYDWRPEKEWRHLGDVDLKQFAPEEVKIIVRTFDEAEQLGEWSPFPVVWWEGLTGENV